MKILLISSAAVVFLILIADIGAMLTWCMGKWGQGDADLQYKYQCRCPPSTEAHRYPETVDIIFSACDYHEVELSPSGRMLLVDDNPDYVWDLKTDEKIRVIWPENSSVDFRTCSLSFLSDDVLLYERWGESQPFDYRTGEQIPMQDIEGAEFPKVSNMAYDDPDDPWCHRFMSYDGKFSYRDCVYDMNNGIYLEVVNQRIIESISGFRFLGWIYDNNGVLLVEKFECHKMHSAGDYCAEELHQPLIKLNIPNVFQYKIPVRPIEGN